MGAKQLSKCKTRDCKLNINGRCKTLTDTKFEAACPFYKKKEGNNIESKN